jgi:hypothetical protein
MILRMAVISCCGGVYTVLTGTMRVLLMSLMSRKWFVLEIETTGGILGLRLVVVEMWQLNPWLQTFGKSIPKRCLGELKRE